MQLHKGGIMADSKSSSADTIVKIVLVFFISLLSFSIGTFVGKKFSDNQHRLSSMEPQTNSHQVDASTHEEPAEQSASEAHTNEAKAEPSGHNAAATTKEDLNDDQVEALANEFVDEEPANSTAKNEKSHSKNTHDEKAQATDHGEETREPASVPPKEALHQQNAISPTTLNDMAQSEGSKYTIQIASYPSEEEAQKKAEDLKKQKFEAFYSPATIKGQTWYRVNVGKFATSKEAQLQKQDLIDKTHINTAIIQKIIK